MSEGDSPVERPYFNDPINVDTIVEAYMGQPLINLPNLNETAGLLLAAFLNGSKSPIELEAGVASDPDFVRRLHTMNANAGTELLYRALLKREPDEEGKSHYSEMLSGDYQMSLDAIGEILASEEYARRAVTEAYRYLLGRDPDEVGFRDAIPLVQSRKLEDVADKIRQSDEFREVHGGTEIPPERLRRVTLLGNRITDIASYPVGIQYQYRKFQILDRLLNGDGHFDAHVSPDEFAALVLGGLEENKDLLGKQGIGLKIDQLRPVIQGNLLNIHASGKAKKGALPSADFKLDLILGNAESGRLVAQGVRFSPSRILLFDIQSRAEERLGGEKINDLMFEGLRRGMETEGVQLNGLQLYIESDSIRIKAQGSDAQTAPQVAEV